jgi:hypothetical protein
MPESTLKPRRRRRRWPWLLAAVLLIAAAVAWSRRRPHLPPPPPVSAEAVVVAKFVCTDQFKALPTETKEQYLRKVLDNLGEVAEAVRKGQLTRDEMQRGLSNGAALAADLQARDYLNLATPAQRNAYVDRLIDQQERLRWMSQLLRFGSNPQAVGSSSSGSAGSAGSSAPAGLSGLSGSSTSSGIGIPAAMLEPAQMKDFLENTDPMTRARVAQYMGEVRKRREERGLPIDVPR